MEKEEYMVRKIIILVCLLCIGTGLIACRSRQPEVMEDKVHLEIWHYWDTVGSRQALNELVEDYNNSQSRAEVHIKYVPDEDFKKQLALSMADGIEPDLAIVDSADIRFFHDMRPFVEVGAIVSSEEYLDIAMLPALIDGHIYGIPLGINCLAFYYNTEMLKEAGIEPPKTLEELTEAAVKLTTPEHYGYAFPTLQTEETLFCLLPILWSEGGEISDMGSAPSQRVFSTMKKILENGDRRLDTMGMTLGDIAREFRKGRIAMMFNSTMVVRDIQIEAPQLKFQVDRLPLEPNSVSVVGGEVLTVLQGSHQEEALAFAHYIADENNMVRYLDEAGYIAPTMDALEDQLERSSEMNQIMNILETARTREFSAQWPKISLAVSETLQEVLQGADQEDSLAALAQKILEIRGGI